MAKIQPNYDLTGKIFGRLKVLNFDSVAKDRNRIWICICECGNKVLIKGKSLKSGRTKSCGCLHKEISVKIAIATFTKHGKRHTKEYNAWLNLRRRCLESTNDHYYRYGARGIPVCEEWRTSFINFYNDMGDAPSKKHSIHRIENDKGYYKENCMWATRKEQDSNKSNVYFEEMDGVLMNRKEIYNLIGISRFIYMKYKNMGFTAQQIKSEFNK